MRKEDQERKIRMQRNMAGYDCSSARAFAVNLSRLPPRPSGLRGLTAQRGQAERAADADLRSREPLETDKRKKC